MLAGKIIHLCVAGGIAAYKAVELARAFQKAGAEVRVAMTPNAQAFVGPLTFQAITRHPVLTRTLDPSEEMEIGHIAFAQECDALVVAPATANLIGKAAAGIGDEIVSTVLLAHTVPVVVAPAMNSFMYAHPAVSANLERLRGWGWHIVEPDAGQLACGQVGPGRLPEADVIVAATARAIGPARPKTLAGRRVLVSAGPTREHFDPVRFLGNPSSGRTGFAVARAAADAGADVILVHGPVNLAPPPGVEVVPVTSARDMHAAITARADEVDAVVMTAAVADWRPAEVAEQKRKKAGERWSVEMVRNPDILARLGAARQGTRPVLVGFAAETGDPVPNARGKLDAKRVDLVVANDVSAPGSGFATETNQVWFVSPDGVEPLPMMAKTALADALVEWVSARLAATEDAS